MSTKNDSAEHMSITQEENSVTQSTLVPPPSPKIDRYGWIISGDQVISDQEKKLRAKESKLELKRVDEWMAMYNNWSYYSAKGRDKVKEFIRHGIPDSCRELAWKIILHPEVMNPLENNQVDLDSLIAKGPTPAWTTIEADLKRTMPNCPMFYSDKVLNSLRRILKAYSMVDTELGYTQGMSFIAAVLLLYLDENTAYNCFAKFLMGERIQWRNYFLPDFPRYYLLVKIWHVALKDKYPKVFQHFQAINAEPLIYTPSWFLTGFLNMDFPPVVRLHIFDCWIEFGSKALLSFALVIVSRNKKSFATDPFEILLPNLQNPTALSTMNDWRYLLKKYDKLWVDEKTFVHYCKLANVEVFP